MTRRHRSTKWNERQTTMMIHYGNASRKPDVTRAQKDLYDELIDSAAAHIKAAKLALGDSGNLQEAIKDASCKAGFNLVWT